MAGRQIFAEARDAVRPGEHWKGAGTGQNATSASITATQMPSTSSREPVGAHPVGDPENVGREHVAGKEIEIAGENSSIRSSRC